MRNPRTGFSLPETLVAFVVLEVGILGAAAMTAIGLETIRRARLLEATLTRAAAVRDSLAELSGSARGTETLESAVISWTKESDGDYEITAVSAAGDSFALRGTSR